MNERVRQLALKLFYEDDQSEPGTYIQLNVEKFAELIVRECAGIYSKIDNGNQHLGTDDYLEALQKHFGVEE